MQYCRTPSSKTRVYELRRKFCVKAGSAAAPPSPKVLSIKTSSTRGSRNLGLTSFFPTQDLYLDPAVAVIVLLRLGTDISASSAA